MSVQKKEKGNTNEKPHSKRKKTPTRPKEGTEKVTPTAFLCVRHQGRERKRGARREVLNSHDARSNKKDAKKEGEHRGESTKEVKYACGKRSPDFG